MLFDAPISIDGVPINTKYLLKEGHLMVPALFIKHVGASVDWNESYRSVVFQLEESYFAIPLGDVIVTKYDP